MLELFNFSNPKLFFPNCLYNHFHCHSLTIVILIFNKGFLMIETRMKKKINFKKIIRRGKEHRALTKVEEHK